MRLPFTLLEAQKVVTVCSLCSLLVEASETYPDWCQVRVSQEIALCRTNTAKAPLDLWQTFCAMARRFNASLLDSGQTQQTIGYTQVV